MDANPEKFQLMFIGLKDDIKLCIDINGIVIQMTDSAVGRLWVYLFGASAE